MHAKANSSIGEYIAETKLRNRLSQGIDSLADNDNTIHLPDDAHLTADERMFVATLRRHTFLGGEPTIKRNSKSEFDVAGGSVSQEAGPGSGAASGLPAAASGLPAAASGLPSAASGLPSAASGLPEGSSLLFLG